MIENILFYILNNPIEVIAIIILSIGVWMDASLKASNPKFRLKALSLQQVGNIMTLIVLLTAGLMFLSLLPVGGIINCFRNMRNRYLDLKKKIKKPKN